jgi:hypothetical protein
LRGDMTAEELYPVTAISVVTWTDTLEVSLHETRNINRRSQRWSELDRSVVNIVGTRGVGGVASNTAVEEDDELRSMRTRGW